MATGTVDQEMVRMAPGRGGMVVSAVGYRIAGVRTGLHRGLPPPYLTLIFSLDGPVTGGPTPEQARGPDAFRADIVVGGLQQAPAYVVQPERESGVQLAVARHHGAGTLRGLAAHVALSERRLT
ncbi:hypothetical protein MOV08_35375 [Streptomyces yunnanensis]|uniref:AraC family transcriptional regulator n=1 Tax=Streptomyces yunnanensis TaxID=156453 RepID=A0ABY8AGD5_9ACTN|nr:hypothetical protein [Streptomyces yunnanensis]WEB44047.1 hypothetical protein MOV08_35375 [Streptomyces yunnanensis]